MKTHTTKEKFVGKLTILWGENWENTILIWRFTGVISNNKLKDNLYAFHFIDRNSGYMLYHRLINIRQNEVDSKKCEHCTCFA